MIEPPTDTKIDIDHARQRIVVITRGPFDLSQLRMSINRQATSGLWHYGTLYDERDCTSAPSAVEVRQLADHVGRLIGTLGRRGPVAIVTADAATYGMVRMYEVLVAPTGLDVQAFRDITTADAWLSAQSTPADRLLSEQRDDQE